mgnify:FL=1
MRSFLSFVRSRTVWLLGVCGLALVQSACAHSVAVQPAVVVQARLGGPVYGSIYAPLYGAPPVMVAPPPPVWVAPSPVVMPYGAWVPPGHRHHHHHGYGREYEHGWGRRDGHGR